MKMPTLDLPDLSKLSIPEKILLVEDLWDSIVSEGGSVPVPRSHVDELDKRAASLATIGKLLTLEELMERIDARK